MKTLAASLRRLRLTTLVVVSLTALTGCETLAYYSQSVSGQLEVLRKRRAIDDVLVDTGTDAKLRGRLSSIKAMRQFAVDELALPDNASYTTYTDLKRRHVVWNVFAAPELSVEPRTWCFPVVGCVVYRGYFAEADAKQYAKKLDAEGFDTVVGGINAYSTLGWFSDPVLNTFMHYSEARLAGLIFHELTHQRIYVNGDSVFNESLATAVELEGVRRWLVAKGDTTDADIVRERIARSGQVTQLLLKTRRQLAAVYDEAIPDEKKRVRKREVFADMRTQYAELKETWGGYGGYDAYFARDFNNARLVSAAAYHSRLPAFEALMRESGGDIGAFWRRVDELASLDRAERDAVLDRLSDDR